MLATTLIVLALVIGFIGTTWGFIRAKVAEDDALVQAAQKEVQRSNAVTERERAIQAECDARRRLLEAKIAEAKASRRSRESGQRSATLKVLAEAVELARELKMNDEVVLTLRTEAIACLALTDVRLVKEWQGFPPGSSGAAFFDANLEHYARCDSKGNISVRRVDDDRQLVELPGSGIAGSDSGAGWMAFSPNGRLLAVRYLRQILGQPTNFLLWDWQQRKIVFQPSFPVSLFGALCFSPDGRQLALGQGDGTVTLLELETRIEGNEIKAGAAPSRLAFSPDGDRLAVCAGDKVQLWEVSSAKLVCSLSLDSSGMSVAWHPDGVLLGVGCDDGNVCLWDAVKGLKRAVLRGHAGTVHRLVFTPSGDTLLTSAWDGTSRLWDACNGRELLRIPGVAGHFSNNGTRLASSNGWSCSLWEVMEAREFRTIPISWNVGKEEIGYGGFSPDGHWLAVTSTKGVRFCDMEVGKEATFLPMSPQQKDVKFHPTEQRLLTGSVDGLYDWPLRQEKGVIRLGPARKISEVGRVEQISLDREGRFLAAAGASTGWILNLVKTPNVVQRVGHGNAIFVAISPDGKCIATGTHNGFGAKVWETQSGNCLINLLPDERIVTVAFSPDARWLVTGTASAVEIWETDDWKLRHRIPINYQSDRCAFSTDSTLLAIALSPSVIQLLDPKTGQSIAQ